MKKFIVLLSILVLLTCQVCRAEVIDTTGMTKEEAVQFAMRKSASSQPSIEEHQNVDEVSPKYNGLLSATLLILSAFVLWLVFGRDAKIVDTVEFYPPNELNSAEVGYLYKGEYEDKQLVSLIVYFASKGYMEISTLNGSGVIKKLKDYDGNNEIEKIFFNNLFKYKDEVKTASMPSGFYEAFNEIKQMFEEDSEVTQNVYTKASIFATVITIFLMSAIIILGLMKIISNLWVVFISLILLIIFFKIMPKRTNESSKMLGEIRGFRNFIEKAKKDELESLVHDNPNYFYDILPYVYVLGVSNEWIIQFQDVALPQIEDIMAENAIIESRLAQIIGGVITDLDYKNWWKDL